jgi:hypothetical protein
MAAAEHVGQCGAVVVVARRVEDVRPSLAGVPGQEPLRPRICLARTVVRDIARDHYCVEVVKVAQFGKQAAECGSAVGPVGVGTARAVEMSAREMQDPHHLN